MAAFLTVTKLTAWRTSDGAQHATKELADRYVLTDRMIEVLVSYGVASAAAAQEVVKVYSEDRHLVRAWLDACDAVDGAKP